VTAAADRDDPAGTTSLDTLTRGTEGRRLAAIMFTDMVGYSALTQRDEALALQLIQKHNLLLRELFDRYGGTEIKAMGDGFLAVFPSGLDAVSCAVNIQESVRAHNAVVSSERAFHVRIGIHVGDVVQRDGDVFGDGVNIAARIEQAANPGGICLSRQAVDVVQHRLKRPIVKLGQAELRNISRPVTLYQVVLPWEEGELSLSARWKFAVRHQRLPSLTDLTSLLFVVMAAGLFTWQSVVADKAFHAAVWFGSEAPFEARHIEFPSVSASSFTGPAADRFGEPGRNHRPPFRTVEDSRPGSPTKRVPGGETRTAPTAPRAGTADLLTLMTQQDSGDTFLFARHYDQVTQRIRRISHASAVGIFARNKPVSASAQRVMFEEALTGAVVSPAGLRSRACGGVYGRGKTGMDSGTSRRVSAGCSGESRGGRPAPET
jgi:class 3 adenylate cyclase